jgi:GntR family transcriptional regulator, transcriptional repressor for pyruvate dehydrogenase complex
VTGPRHTRITQRRIAEVVAAELRARILSDDNAERLPPQDQLVAEFGVSYPSVREALRILETEGLITVRRGNVGGAEVHRPDPSSAAYHLGLGLQAAHVTLGDLAVGLQMLEPTCAAACAQREDRATAVLPALAANVNTCAELMGEGLPFTLAARSFHDLVVSFNPNLTVRYVVSTLVALWSAHEETWAEILTRSGEYPSPVDSAESLDCHRHIIAAIEDGRAEDAERLYRDHLTATQQLVLDHFDTGPVDVSSTQVSQAIQQSRGTHI